MLVNQSIGQHTLSLFSQRANSQTANPNILETVRADLRKEPAASFKPSVVNDMSGFYKNPVNMSGSQPLWSEVATRTLESMTSLQSNELKSAQGNFKQAAEAELGRTISSDGRLSPDERSSLSYELRRNIGTVETFRSRLELALVDVTELRVFGGSAYSDEELINKTINDLVGSRVGAIQKIMELTNDPEFTKLVGASNQVTGPLQPLNDASVDALRTDLLAHTWARYESGDLVITLADRTR